MSFIGSLATIGGMVGVTGTIAAPLAGAGILAAGGAGLGAATSALTGGDPGEGALMGGIAAPLVVPLGMGAAGAGAGAGGGLATTPLASSGAFVPTNAAFTGGTAASAPNAVVSSLAPTTMGGAGGTTIAGAGNTVGNIIAPSAAGSISEFAVAHPIMTGAGIGALGGAITNPNDPMKGALQGGAAGAIGGWGAGQLGGMAGAGGTLGKIGQFAASNPGITSAGIGMLASPVIGSIMPDFSPSEQDELDSINAQDRADYLRYSRQYRPSLAPGYAAGGITDLDGYMSNAQNIPNSQNLGLAQGGVGTQNIPNQNEVADPEGYGSNSTTMMAGGGIVDWLAKNSLPGMIFDWKGASDIPLIGGMFQDQSQIANLTPEEKKKLMEMAAAQGKPAPAMARGGIADLGGYSKGGNLLAGPGDGVSDDIPASIAGKQPARLATGEYVIPSRIVSELGNGSTDAGAKRLDMMVQKVNAGRSKTLGGKRYAKDTRAYKHLPV